MSLLETLERGGWLRVVDAELARVLQRHAPQPVDAHGLVLAAAALASRAIAQGHAALPLPQLPAFLREIAPDRPLPPLPEAAAWLAALQASPWVAVERDDNLAEVGQQATPLVLSGTRIALRRYWHYEVRLAAALSRLARDRDPPDSDWCEARLDALFPARREDPDDAQAAAARRLLESHLLLLVGGPGTGKTTTVARALLLRMEQALLRGEALPRIALAAPTGKAAARLAEALRENLAQLRNDGGLDPRIDAALPTEARTLHRLLGWRADATTFRHGIGHPLDYDLVVVDEASMVDLPLMCKLVEAVHPQATLLLVGDRDQLPSVETGDVLAALGDAADAGGALAARRVALTRSWRQRNAPQLSQLATCVRAGDADTAVALLDGADAAQLGWHQGGTRDLHALLAARALPRYRALQQAASPGEALALAGSLRVLTAVREGPAGSHTLNAWFASTLQPVGTRPAGLFHGALLMITRNSYRHGLYNGDIGIAWAEPDGSLRVWFERDNDTGSHGPALRAWLPAALPEHEPAFALTVHKSQGSEFDEVLLVLPAVGSGFSRALSREGLYTGLTRARRSLALFADEPTLREAIAQPAQRWSGLAERLG